VSAPTQNPNDGTQLGTSEVIADEYIDPTMQEVRQEPLLPVTGYKLPRSKIAVGQYGIDGGDAAPDRPLYTESVQQRRLDETRGLRERTLTMVGLQMLSSETIPLMDARGYDISTRGVR
jgi:hypothetical protein